MIDYLGRTNDAWPLEALFAPPAAPASTPPLTPQEQDLLRKYRELDPRGKQAVLDTIDREHRYTAPKTEDEAM